jgi:UDP-2-acetamido-2-deoxy-ribo-hexuluronate aminotransferase
MEFNDLKSQYNLISESLQKKFSEICAGGSFIMGKEVKELEAKLASYTGAKHAIAVANGTDALTLALMAIDLKENEEVIMPAFTYFATAEATAILKGKCVFVDINEETYNIDEKLIEKAITKKTRAIMPVSLFGQCCNMNRINEIAKKHGLIVIEDAAQSFGAVYDERKSCNLSDIGSTSFFPSKPLGCYGDGGMLFTSNDEIANKLRMLRVHGQSVKYVHDIIGMNSRLDTLQAAVLLEKIKLFDDEIAKRQRIAERYNEALKRDFQVPTIASYNKLSVWAQYVLRSEKREEIILKLKEQNIPTAIYYPIPITMQKVFQGHYKENDFPISCKVANEVFSIPFSPYLSSEDQEKVIEVLLK